MEQDSVDLKIVFMHWGFEFEFYPDSMIQNFAKKLSDAGADIIVGAHPHVIQPVVYLSRAHQNKPPTLVYYSLGNFCSQMYTTACKTGMIAHVAVNRNGMNQLSASALKPVFIYTQKRGWTAKKTKLHLISSLAFEKPQDLSNRKWKKIRKSLKAFE
jgi:poly-gamma-glutamate capsule biosynthesis protein CapA/YwtB (metallophosphatase superfamily)